MPTLYVYAPVSGQLVSLDCYCSKAGCNSTPPCGPSGCTHTIVGGAGFSSPIDMGWFSNGTIIRFRASSGVQSIEIEYISNVCASVGSPWTDGIKVHMYRFQNRSCYMGTILYGHLKRRVRFVADGAWFNYPSGGWAQPIGKLPADCLCGCSTGIHIHMETNVGTRTSQSCGNSLTTSSWIYSWFWNDGWC